MISGMFPGTPVIAAILGFLLPFSLGRSLRSLAVVGGIGLMLALAMAFVLPRAVLVAGLVMRLDEAGFVLFWATLFACAGRALSLAIRPPKRPDRPLFEYMAIGWFILVMLVGAPVMIPVDPVACPEKPGLSPIDHRIELRDCLINGGPVK